MKSLLILIAFMALTSFAQSPVAKETSGVTGNQSLTIELSKKDFYLLEPIPLTISGMLRPIFIPHIDDAVSVIVISKGERKTYQGINLFVITEDCYPAPGGESACVNRSEAQQYFERPVYIGRVQEFFPRPGDYTIQFTINGAVSNVVDVRISKPKDGNDLEAFNFLSKLENPLTFEWIWREKDGIKQLESFVAKYADTPYGDLAIWQLAIAYAVRGQNDKARTEFEKVKLSKNEALATGAKTELHNLEYVSTSQDQP